MPAITEQKLHDLIERSTALHVVETEGALRAYLLKRGVDVDGLDALIAGKLHEPEPAPVEWQQELPNRWYNGLWTITKERSDEDGYSVSYSGTVYLYRRFHTLTEAKNWALTTGECAVREALR